MNSEIKSITALYARVSTAHGQEKGLEAQVRTLKAFCKKNNITNYKIYEDKISGSKSSRPMLNKLMEEAQKGTIEKVIVYSFSRFARSTKHLLEASEKFKTLDIEFVSLSENIDTSTAIGNAFFTIISAIAQLERELISERVKNGLANAIAKGKKVGRPKKIPTKTILEFHSKGYSTRKISKIINFSHTAIAKEIRNSSCKQTQEKEGL